jgi:DNA-binding transcriptional regulator YhcF (GntR family)
MSLEFKTIKSIYLQIAENICNQIMEGTLKPGDRVTSVRDLAADYEVNRNTLLKTFALLENDGIFDNKRGVGFYVSVNAKEIIYQSKRAEFFLEDYPEFVRKARFLKLKSEELKEFIETINQNDNYEKK